MIKTMTPDMSVLGTIQAGMSEDGEMPVTAWISHLPEIVVEVRDFTYFAGNDGYVWCASYDAKADFARKCADKSDLSEKAILVENARWNTIEALSTPVVPESVEKCEIAVASALTLLHLMPVDEAEANFA